MNSTVAGKSKSNILESENFKTVSRESEIPSDLQKLQKLEYVFDMLRELRVLAREAKAESLVYYLEMAALEAGELCDIQRFRKETCDAP